MKTETLEALRGSIAKWTGIAAGEAGDRGSDNCPLCDLFNTDVDDIQCCVECPVFLRTGRRFCEGTPYYPWIELREPDTRGDQWCADGRKAVTDVAKEAAKAELHFLESLLPVQP